MRTQAIIVLSVIGVCIVLLHLFVFAPLSTEWSAQTDLLNKQITDLEKMIKSLSGISVISPSTIIRETKKMLVEQVATVKQLTKVYEFEDPSIEVAAGPVGSATGTAVLTTPTPDYRQALIEKMHKIKEYQTSVQTTKLRLLESWGIGDAIVPGKFGNAYLANENSAYAFPAKIGLAEQGCIEFFISPQWAPVDDPTFRVLASIVGYKPMEPGAKPPKDLPTCSINLIKDKSQLILQLNSYAGAVESFAYDISNWEKNSWHQVAASWVKERGDATLFVDGRSVGRTGMKTNSRGGESGMMGEFGSELGRGSGRRRDNDSGTRLVSGMIQLDAIYLGSDAKGNNPADSVFDEFRVSTISRSDFQLDKPIQADADTAIYRDFEQELVSADGTQLARTLEQMRQMLLMSNNKNYSEDVRNRYKMDYEVLRRSLGINVDKIEKLNANNAVLEELYLVDYLRSKVQENTMNDIVDLLGIHIPPAKQIQSLTAFLDIALTIAKEAVDEQVPGLNEVRYIGESLEMNEEALWIEFDKEVKALEEKYPPSVRGQFEGAGGFDAAAEAEMMGMGGYGAGMAPSSSVDTTKREDIKKLTGYLEYQKRGEVSPEFLAHRQATVTQQAGGNVYIKRMVQIRFSSSVEEFARLLHRLEYSDLLASIDKFNIKVQSDEEGTLENSVKVDFHFLAPVDLKEEWITQASTGEATGEAPVSVPPPAAPQQAPAEGAVKPASS